MTPQTPPSTVMGTPTVARTPIARTASAAAPDVVEKSSIRAGRPVSNTRVVTFRPPSAVRAGGAGSGSVTLHPTMVTTPSGS